MKKNKVDRVRLPKSHTNNSRNSTGVMTSAEDESHWDESEVLAIFESMADVIITIDPFGKILACNPASAEMFGYEPEELVNHKINKLMPSKESSEHDGYLDKYAKGGLRYVIGHRREVMGQKKDGTKFPIELCVSEANVKGRILFTGIIRDITKRKREEEAMKEFARNLEFSQSAMEDQAHHLAMMSEELHTARLEADAANRTKSEFLANMSHEIRTPMTAILGYTDILIDELKENPFLHESASVIKRNGENLLALINDILDLSKIESGQMDVESVLFSPTEILSQVISLLKNRAEIKGIELTLETEGIVPDKITSDPTRLRQILINLVGNAIKFTEKGGVRVRIVGNDNSTQSLRFDVVDSGIGIAPEKTEIIFEPFKQSDNSTTRKHGGTGLGLAICKKMIAALGGTLSVQSELNKGSQFSFSLPEQLQMDNRVNNQQEERHGLDSQKRPIDSSRKNPSSENHILLVEDSNDNLKLIQFFLEKIGAVVTTATNGQEAIDVLMSNEKSQTCPRFDLVFMDMSMPILDGYAATKNLRAQGYAGKIVALTAHAMTGDREKCLEAGCDDFLTKPISKKQLAEMMKKQGLVLVTS